MNRLISHTPPLSAETTKVRRRADQGRELVNVLELNNMGEADLVDQPADELGSMLEEGRLVESLRPDVGALVAGRDELGRGDVVLVVEATETQELLKVPLREVTPPLRVARTTPLLSVRMVVGILNPPPPKTATCWQNRRDMLAPA